MPQLDRPPLPSYEELFLSPPRSTSHSSFETLPGFSTSSSISSSTPRAKAASFASSTTSFGDKASRNTFDRKITIEDGSLVEDANNNNNNNDVSNSDVSNNDGIKTVGNNNEPNCASKEDASVLSVREQAKKLNKLHSESELEAPRRSHGSSVLSTPDQQRSGGRRSVAAGSADAPVSLTKELRKWMVLSATVNYHPIAKMISENKNLVHFKDIVTGYTPLHWAAKSGQVIKRHGILTTPHPPTVCLIFPWRRVHTP